MKKQNTQNTQSKQVASGTTREDTNQEVEPDTIKLY
jgi:hypothetical protein